jgi:hypothetical protein
MVLFGKNFKLQKYTRLSDIFVVYCEERYDGYVRQKEWLLRTKKRELFIHEQKQKFLHLILTKQLDLSNYLDDDLEEAMTKKFGLQKLDHSFQYLLGIPIQQLTKSRLDQLAKKIVEIKKDIHRIEKTTPGQFWITDLEALEEALLKK